MKTKKLLDAVLVAALLLANIPELTEDVPLDPREPAYVEATETQEENVAEGH